MEVESRGDKTGDVVHVENNVAVSPSDPVSPMNIVMANDLARANRPQAENIYVSKSSRVQIGTKLVSVTQNVYQNEVVKVRLFGLGLLSSKAGAAPSAAGAGAGAGAGGGRACRCSVVVFVCWASFAICALCALLLIFVLPQQKLLDIEVSLPEYIKTVVKNSTRTERVACAVVILALVICILLIIYFTMIANHEDIALDTAPHEWNITREMWLAQPYDDVTATALFEPLRLVIINHSAGNECHRFITCAAELRNLQTYFLNKLHYDIPFNFMLGNDGRVYEGRGWGVQGAHTISYNRCSLGIGFLGDYRPDAMNTRPTSAQVNRTFMLLDYGVRHGFLHPDYVIVGGRDIYPKDSPGINLYNMMQTWDHYNKDRFYGMSCEQIHFGANWTAAKD